MTRGTAIILCAASHSVCSCALLYNYPVVLCGCLKHSHSHAQNHNGIHCHSLARTATNNCQATATITASRSHSHGHSCRHVGGRAALGPYMQTRGGSLGPGP